MLIRIGGSPRVLALAVQFVDRAEHGLRAAQRIAGVGMAGEGRAERRHQSVAEIFVERSLMPENLALHPFVELPQRPDHLDRAAAVGIGGEADDVGEQHRHVLGADLLERLVVFRQLLDDIGRKIARQIGALAFDPGMADQQRVGAAHRHRERHRDDQEHDDFLKPLRRY